jgi:hypothetical protein
MCGGCLGNFFADYRWNRLNAEVRHAERAAISFERLKAGFHAENIAVAKFAECAHPGMLCAAGED